jgi:predicted metalloenzyme YecM
MRTTRKILVSVAAALILVCGHVFANQAFDGHVIHLVKVAQDIPAEVSTRIAPEVMHLPMPKDY